jgi:hypothetical protein
LNRAGRMVAVGQPAIWLMQGWLTWLSGDNAGARRALQRSLDLSEQLSMPYVQAMANYNLGSCLEDSNAKQYLEAARDSFSQLGALYYTAQSKILLRARQKAEAR